MPDGGWVVVTLGPDDVDSIVAMHQRVFPDSVLTKLGFEALRRYYLWQIEGPHEVQAFGVVGGERLLGLLVGGRFRGSMIGFLKREAPYLATQVVRHPGLVFQSRGRGALSTGVRLLAGPARTGEVERPERVPDESFGVLLVAVDSDVQRGGLGRMLLGEAERRAREAGLRRLHLTLDPTNWSAMAFYNELGWRRLGVPGDTDRQWLMGKEILPA